MIQQKSLLRCLIGVWALLWIFIYGYIYFFLFDMHTVMMSNETFDGFCDAVFSKYLPFIMTLEYLNSFCVSGKVCLV